MYGNGYILLILSSGSFSLCLRKYLSLMAYCAIPVLDVQTFSISSALSRPLSRESWSCNFTFFLPTFATSRLQEILAAKVGTMWV
jgi:hypothetical protein